MFGNLVIPKPPEQLPIDGSDGGDRAREGKHNRKWSSIIIFVLTA